MDHRDQDLLGIGKLVSQCARIPHVLQAQPIWLLWRLEEVNGRMTKVPYNAKTGRKASSTDPATWASFDVAARVLQGGGYSGLGIGISNDIAAIDIDHCVGADGALSDMAQDVVERMDSYTELSPSGTGVRIIFTAPGFVYDKARHYINNQRAGLEVYIAGCTNKYVTITGKVLRDAPVAERSAQVQGVLEAHMRRAELPKMERPAKPAPAVPATTPPAANAHSDGSILSDADVLRKAQSAANGADFMALWAGQLGSGDSHSEADLALCNHLAFWTRGDATQMDRLFRASGLYRDKWERVDYRDATIQKAIDGCASFYEPKHADSRAAAPDSKAMTQPGSAEAQPIAFMLNEQRPEANKRYRWTDIGSGRLFADVFKSTARYVPERKKWYVFTGRRWQPDVEGLHTMNLCKLLADQLVLYALGIRDEELRKSYLDYVNKWQSRAFRERILKDASSVHHVSIDQFDKNPMLFNCLNGTLDLERHLFYAHRPEDMLSKVAGVHYDPEAQCERWDRFIREIMQDDDSKAAFLMKALGYSLTGDTSYECLFIPYGATSRNGKSTLVETFRVMMGDYGKSCRPDTIAQRQQPNGGGPSEDIARLAGARFVNISEPDKKLVLSAALVKTLTGNDTILARYLHENSFEFKPQFKLFINTNHLPQVTDVTLFSSGRVKVIPFEHHFTEAERDPGLKAELTRQENLSGILNWCIEGLKLIEELGFEPPASVLAATDAYRMDSDKFSRFLEEEFERDIHTDTQTSVAYTRYQAWCAKNGFQVENSKNFKAGMSSSVEIRYKRPAGEGRNANPTNVIVGYRMLSTSSAPSAHFYS